MKNYPIFLDKLAKDQILILDDWLHTLFTETQANDILEIEEERSNKHLSMATT